jgi:hypothetical protein
MNRWTISVNMSCMQQHRADFKSSKSMEAGAGAVAATLNRFLLLFFITLVFWDNFVFRAGRGPCWLFSVLHWGIFKHKRQADNL